MDVKPATASPAAAASGSNPWESDHIRAAITTLNDGKTSIDEKLTAYKAISDLIASTPSQGGAARVAVVSDEGYTRFAARTNEAGARLDQGAAGARDSSSTYRQLANFDALSAEDQKILATLSPFGGVEDYRAHLQALADVGRAVEGALAPSGYNHVSQLKDPRFEGLKALVLGGYAASANWTKKAQDVLAALTSFAPRDQVSLSPEAEALTSAGSAAEVALQSLRRGVARYQPGSFGSRLA